MGTRIERGLWCPQRVWVYAAGQVSKGPRAYQAALRAFLGWLRDSRGLVGGTVVLRLQSVRQFMAWLGGRPRAELRRLTARDVERFFVEFRQEHGPASQRNLQTALRLFLRFGAERRWCSAALADAVPVLHVYRLSEVPRGLSDDQVALALRSVPIDTEAGVRDLAILSLLATYGVRRGQVAQLRMSDIDWRGRVVQFRAHKGGKPIRHALTASVATAVGRYVDRFRPRVSDDHVFLRAREPHLPLNPTVISNAVSARLRQAGVDAPLLSPHAFRHAFATRLLRVGRPLKQVADLLGHRHLGSAAIYGKVDVVALRRLSAEWPAVLL